LGAYAAGSNPRLDASIRVRNGLMDFLRQDAHATSPRAETLERLDALAAALA
jgi:flagellum-specific ATP synthase